jgi:protein-S-isoprenylcysteine O-methyltransferase Ste14
VKKGPIKPISVVTDASNTNAVREDSSPCPANISVARFTSEWILPSKVASPQESRAPNPNRLHRVKKTCLNQCVTRRILAIVGSAIFLVLAPGMLAGVVPWWISHWRVEAALLGLPVLRFAGGVLLVLGAVGVLDSFGRFAIQGIGTPAPVFPTRHLVVTGLYRYVRNPIYVAVVSTILGQGLILGNVRLLEYGGLLWLFFHLAVLIYEEPTLRASFGSEYSAFCAEVPRWIPRLTPWTGHPESSGD